MRRLSNGCSVENIVTRPSPQASARTRVPSSPSEPIWLTADDLMAYARALGLDVDRFSTELRKRKHALRVERDMDSADQSGVTGTPTFFANGVRLNAGMPEIAHGRYDLVLDFQGMMKGAVWAVAAGGAALRVGWGPGHAQNLAWLWYHGLRTPPGRRVNRHLRHRVLVDWLGVPDLPATPLPPPAEVMTPPQAEEEERPDGEEQTDIAHEEADRRV